MIYSEIESLLLVAQKPISYRKLSALLQRAEEDVRAGVEELAKLYEDRGAGFALARDEKNVQLVTAQEHADLVQTFLRDETSGELTRPSLETLAIIAYRGPVSKAEIELIRGVNCSLILRNLMIRGLVDERQEKTDFVPLYSVTLDFLKFLGISRAADLPNYETLNENKSIDELLRKESDHEDTPE
ncbi:MAG: SMC-Scp complex subunit ScpB [Candidatus Kerfeldbacteria bacterium]|nr:SMC-Scp complex subunit ScpB [Candidatus Kerfeldbacteria bacterium]